MIDTETTITDQTVHYECTYRAQLINAPITRMQYGRYDFRPTRIRVEYYWHTANASSPVIGWVIRLIIIYGPQVRKNGSDGVNRKNYYSNHDDTPVWLETIAEFQRRLLAPIPDDSGGETV